MPLKITTWNINSVRLRIDLVARFLKSARPDVLCLQETKCPDDAFPLKRFKRLGYDHAAVNGQKGYHGVAVLSRVPFERFDIHSFCGKTDCRHISITLGERAGLRDPLTVHNFYVPAGGDEPDPEINIKFRHKLDFLDEMRAHKGLRPVASQRSILVGDLNVAPLEHEDLPAASREIRGVHQAIVAATDDDDVVSLLHVESRGSLYNSRSHQPESR